MEIDSIYILGHCWKVQTMDDLTDFGECDFNHRTIRLRRNQSEEQLIETLLHEINHAIWSMTDLEDKDKEETTVTRLAMGLASVFFDERNRGFKELLQ